LKSIFKLRFYARGNSCWFPTGIFRFDLLQADWT